MRKLYRYSVEDRDYNEGTFFTENYKEAERYAVKDFTPNDEEEE
jgi:hypothetical protein